MGLGNKLIVSATGFPGTNKTLRFIQDAFREPLGALAQLAGNKTIITGVVVDNTNPANVVVSNGFISYNGEIIPFVGGSYANTVTIIEAFENVNYNTDANDDTVLDSLPAYRTIYAKCGTGGIDIFNFSELAPLKTIKELSSFTLPAGIVIDPNYLAFTVSMLNHLNSIEFGAEVNVQADWNITAPSSDAFIKNKPFSSIKFTQGQMTTTNRINTTNAHAFATNFNYNRTYIYPPTGYTVSNLTAFIPSLNMVHFNGDVNSDDTLFCNYQVDYTNNRVIVICNNSENRADSRINYLAVWIKY